MKKKKNKNCYISCRNIEKMKFQNALATRYQLMFTDSIEDADMFVAPRDLSGLLESQKRDLEKAEALGVSYRIVIDSDKLLEMDKIDPLNLNPKEEVKENEEMFEEDEGFELELI